MIWILLNFDLNEQIYYIAFCIFEFNSQLFITLFWYLQTCYYYSLSSESLTLSDFQNFTIFWLTFLRFSGFTVSWFKYSLIERYFAWKVLYFNVKQDILFELESPKVQRAKIQRRIIVQAMDVRNKRFNGDWSCNDCNNHRNNNRNRYNNHNDTTGTIRQRRGIRRMLQNSRGLSARLRRLPGCGRP